MVEYVGVEINEEPIDADIAKLIAAEFDRALSRKIIIEVGKRFIADGCKGCAFEDREEWVMPCRECKRSHKDYWRAKE